MTTCFVIWKSRIGLNSAVVVNSMHVTSQLSVSYHFISSLHRTIAPIFGGGLYSVSLTEKARAIGFPFDYNLIFIIFSVVYFAVIFMTACMPASLDHQKIVKKEGD